MKWRKMGLIYAPDGTSAWARHSALTPTPVLVDNETIRVYVGFRDERGVSRIGFVDVDADNPSKIKHVSRTPVLDVGLPGTFDDNGVILGDIVKNGDELRMYYVGFQLVEKVKFLAFTGLALSSDGGLTFKRYSRVPVLDRSDDGIYIRAIHSVMIEDGVWKIWFASGNGWEWIDGKPYPQYNIRYTESTDGIKLSQENILCIDVEKNEYRIGRPRVYKRDKKYIMLYTKGAVNGDYLPGYAESFDGKEWVRQDDRLGITLSESGWDSKSLCYPSLLEHGGRVYMFYNGNNYGKTGFGYAVLEEW